MRRWLREIDEGTREPLAMACLPYSDYLTMGQWETDTDKHIAQCRVNEIYYRDWRPPEPGGDPPQD